MRPYPSVTRLNIKALVNTQALGLLVWFTSVFPTFANPPQSNYFTDHIRPIFQERCFACHGALKQEANLRVDTASAILNGGDNGPIVVPSQPENSLLVDRVTSSDLSSRMPPEGHALTTSQIDTIKTWIADGALRPANDHPEPSPSDHWAFQPISRPPIINENRTDYFANPIDYFLSLELANKKLFPQTTAEPSTRLRRLYLDLIGIPPTSEQLNHFLKNTSPDAYNQIAIQLLNSPQHGERWARHWMDVWRYADWFGRRYVPDVWNSAPQIWHWRDWIVRSLNEDVGYDQMIREMLAADEIKPGDRQAAVATGFLIRNWYALNPNDWMRSNVEHTGKAFLGLTFQCAHCHDHKYDPISQDDYFRFRAFFEPIGIRQDQLPGEPDPGPFQEYEYSTLRKVQRLGIVSIFDKNLDAKTYFYTGGDERNRDSSHSLIIPTVPQFLAHIYSPPTANQHLPPKAFYPGLDPDLRSALIADLDHKINQAQSNLATLEAQLQSALNDPTIQAAIAQLNRLEKTINTEPSSPESTAHKTLSGAHSLLFNALNGRRMIFRSLPEIQEAFNQAEVSFDIAILTNSHFNFQLTRDSTQGLTATFVGFENGEIRAYQPKSFQEFVVARMEQNESPLRFHVKLKVDLALDQALLSIQSLTKDKPLATEIPIALNGWNPHNDLTKGILFDARPGSLAAVDNIRLNLKPNDSEVAPPLLHIDFEPSQYPLHSDIISFPNWQSLSFSIPPANSRIADHIPSVAQLTHNKELNRLQRVAKLPHIRLRAAQAQLMAAQTERNSLLATIEADNLNILEHSTQTKSTAAMDFAQKAQRIQTLAALHRAEATFLAAEQALAECESPPESDTNRSTDLTAATKTFDETRSALDTTRAKSQLAPTADYVPLTRIYPRTSTGRRRALAEWITHPENPLTARVAINHIWMRHFHKPLVPNVFDFGRSSPAPQQLALLNWLAAELIESNWSMKRIHYIIVTSEAFQRSTSMTHPHAQAIDPDNQLYWRMNTGRMEAEVVRDSLLHIAGSLDRQLGGQELENSSVFTTNRRSLYYCCQPEEDGKSPIGQLFDGPDPTDCYRRTRTIIPQQALALTNSPLIHQVSRQLNEQIQKKLLSDFSETKFVEHAFQAILSRNPTPSELNECLEFIAPSSSDVTTPASYNRYEGLLRVLFNHNDFVTIR